MTIRPIITITAAAALLAFAAPAIAASDDLRKTSASHDRCVEEAKALPGAERDKAIERCDKPATSQQNKMKTCNAEAKTKDLHGDERRAFMSTCLKG